MKVLKSRVLFIYVVGFISVLFSFSYLHTVTYYELTTLCIPRGNLLFLKTHKTASSSIQNILMRYANRHNLLLALPIMTNYFGHPQKFTSDMVPKLEPRYNYTYNILAHHARYNYESMNQFMPQNSIFITILRDPAIVFQSLYSYYLLDEFYNLNISTYLSGKPTMNRTRYGGKLGLNQMSFDLGIDEQFFEDEEVILQAVQHLDKQFDLVMIAELIDESLVLLKNKLCWSTNDIITFKHNARIDPHKENLSQDLVKKLRRVQKADGIIYDYFYKRLKERIRAFDIRKMKFEVKKLQLATDRLYKECVQERSETQFNDYEMIREFELNVVNNINSECKYLVKAELNFTQELFDKQMKYLQYGGILKLGIDVNNYITLMNDLLQNVAE